MTAIAIDAAVLAALGLFSGFVIALLGVGGGVVMTPALLAVLTLLGADPAAAGPMAAATSLAVIALASLQLCWRRGMLSGDAASWRGDGAAMALGAALAPALALQIPPRAFLAMLALALIGVGALRWAAALRGARRMATRDDAPPSRIGPWPMRGFFALSGLVAGGFGLGGGLAGMIASKLRGMDLRAAVDLAPVFALAVATPALPAFIWLGIGAEGRPWGSLGYVHLPSVAVAALAARLGAAIGQAAQNRLSDRQIAFGLALYLSGAGAAALWAAVG